MNNLKTTLTLAGELLILFVVLKFIAVRWVLPEISYGGDAGIWALLIFIVVFVIDSLAYLALTLIYALKKEQLSKHYRTLAVILILIFVTLLIPGAIYLSLWKVKLLWILYLLPLLLFFVHSSIAKLLTRQKS